nr:zinc finger MYM-type protein 1-like [Hydra vulgaris]XP_047145866.1 zinc finger MYM-type protein 1-like [Hydra vulgaris]
MACISLQSVRYLLENGFIEDLQTLYSELSIKINLLHKPDLYQLLTVHKSIKRNLSVERDIPQETRTTMAVKSESTGNCLFSSFSIYLCGDNSLAMDLRMLTAIDLYLNASFYSNHPSFVSLCSKYPNEFSSIDNLLAVSVSTHSIDSGKLKDDLVKEEAFHMCKDFVWSGFLCVLALSTVCSTRVQCYYRTIGSLLKYKIMFNLKIEPRILCSSSDIVNLLFCFEGINPPCPYKHNHYVPLVFIPDKKCLKRKICKKVNFTNQSTIHMFAEKYSINEVSSISTINDKSVSCTLVNKKCMSSSHKNIVCNSFIDSKSFYPINTLSSNQKSSNTKDKSILFTENMGVESSLKKLSSEPCSEFDIACFRSKASTLKDLQLKNLIRNVFVPDETYSFPKTNRRSFKLIWLKQFSSLSYSPSEDGAFCLCCVLFGYKYPSKASRCKNLYSQPFKYWPDAVCTFNRHYHGKKGNIYEHHSAVQSLHYNTWTIFSTVLNTMNGNIQSIDILINKEYEKEIALNRKKLRPIVDSIIFLGQLKIAFRGHCDDSQYHPTIGKYSLVGGVGNFIVLLNYRIRGGDKVLEHHLNSCAKNASYISNSSQNELISCCGQYIQNILVSKIKENQFFSIIADEASDCSNQEQLSLVIRFIDKSYDVREEFMGFLHCELGSTGEALCKTILSSLKDFSLDISNCRGQGYDGASSATGHVKGIAKRIKDLNHKAVYTHCFSHRLNLSVINSCKIQEVRNMMEHVKQLSYFFNFSESRQNLLEVAITEHCPLATKKKLIDVCCTRWVERITGLDDFENLFVPIVFCQNDAIKSKLVTSFDFIASLVITRTVLDYTISVT